MTTREFRTKVGAALLASDDLGLEQIIAVVACIMYVTDSPLTPEFQERFGTATSDLLSALQSGSI